MHLLTCREARFTERGVIKQMMDFQGLDQGCELYGEAAGFFFGNTELSLELWTVIAGISGFDD